MSVKQDLTGRRYTRLVVVNEGPRLGPYTRWYCLCDCGNIKLAKTTSLNFGYTKSCGCLQRETSAAAHRTHGMRFTSTWEIWRGMKARCFNPKQARYADYGGRGITVCKKWLTFEGFFADMGERPPGKSIDRINNDGDYKRSNCRWATPIEQANNTRRKRA